MANEEQVALLKQVSKVCDLGEKIGLIQDAIQSNPYPRCKLVDTKHQLSRQMCQNLGIVIIRDVT